MQQTKGSEKIDQRYLVNAEVCLTVEMYIV